MVEVLGHINAEFERLGLNYEFDEWTSEPLPRTFWVGEYSEVDGYNELAHESTFILTGTTFDSRIVLEQQKDIIEKEFRYGKTAILADGTGVAVCYVNGFGIPSEAEGIKRIQINLNIKEWKVN